MNARPKRAAVAGLALGTLTALTLVATAGADQHSSPSPHAPGSSVDPPSAEIAYPPACRMVGIGEPQPVVAPTVGGSPGTPFTVDPSLPPGLTLDPASGAVTGTPTAAESGVVRVVATGSQETGLDLAVIEAALAYPLAQFSPVPGRPLAPLVPAVTLSSGTASFAATGLPEGLSIDPATGTIAGRVESEPAPGPVTITMSVASNGGVPCGDITQTLEIPPLITAPPDAACPTRPKRIYVPLAATRPTQQQMFTNLEHARAAVTRMNALRAWLDRGIIPRRDVCNHTLGAADLDPAVGLVRGDRRDATGNWTTRPVTGFGYRIRTRGRRPLTESSFAAVEARVRAAELRFVAIRGALMRGVAGADFRERLPAGAKLAQDLYAAPGDGAGGAPAAPAVAGGPDPAQVCRTNATTLARLRCQHLRAVRMIHLSNVIRQALLNRIHGAPSQYDVAESTTARRGIAAARLASACNADFPSELCTRVNGRPAAEADAAIDDWLTRLRDYEVRYLGGAMRHFGIADGSIGSAQLVPNAPAG